MRILAFLWICTLAVGGCASFTSSKRSADACSQAASSKPFRSAESVALAGKYELTLISQWQDERGKLVRGQIELWAPDTLFQHYEPSWYAKYDSKSPGLRLLPKDSITTWMKVPTWRPLIGVVDIDLTVVSVPMSNQLKSRDPFEPGVRLEGSSLQLAPVRLGFLRLDGSSAALTIERTWIGGFSGKWNTSGWGVVIRNGREVPDPEGTFCARRVYGSGLLIGDASSTLAT